MKGKCSMKCWYYLSVKIWNQRENAFEFFNIFFYRFISTRFRDYARSTCRLSPNNENCKKKLFFRICVQLSKSMNIISSELNSYFLHWNFDWKSCFVVFFLEWNEWKNPQFNFSSQNLSIERNFFKWDGKETKISHLLFHRIWKN